MKEEVDVFSAKKLDDMAFAATFLYGGTLKKVELLKVFYATRNTPDFESTRTRYFESMCNIAKEAPNSNNIEPTEWKRIAIGLYLFAKTPEELATASNLIKNIYHEKEVPNSAIKKALNAAKASLATLHHYANATSSEKTARYHGPGFLTAKDITQQYKQLRGDVLKTEILMDAKARIEECINENQLNAFIKEFAPKLKILETAQGVALLTRLGIKETTSKTTFDAMVNSKRTELKNAPEQETPQNTDIQL